MTRPLDIKNRRLLIISHTEHYLDEGGNPNGWTSTVREIDFLASHFKEVVHLAVLHAGQAPQSTTAYQAPNVKFESIAPFGGAGIKNKFQILWVMPNLWMKMHRLLRNADLFQFRAPTSIGLMVIPVLTLFYKRKKGWYKYAGNWMQPNMPLSYKVQKWLLQKVQKRPVTINGAWPNQPEHVNTFENPCLSADELPIFRKLGEAKEWNPPFTACFVGRMEDAKGVHRLVDLLMQPGIEKLIGTFHFVGDGPKLPDYERQVVASGVTVHFHGFLSRDETFAIYARSNLFMLPSDSEGFPKVVAESAAFGCVPVVSGVSSIGQYINELNGYLWTPLGDDFSDFFTQSNVSEKVIQSKSHSVTLLAERFTFEHFFSNLEKMLAKAFHA